MTLTGIEKLVLTGANTVTSATGAVTFETTNATSLDSITLTNAGTNSIVIALGQTATNLNVDASASIGATTIDASLYATATGATLRGGSGNDIVEGSANGDNIVGGAGNDVLSGTATAGQVAGTALAVGSIGTSIAAATVSDTFTGGAGMDVFGIGVSALAAMSTITDLNLGTAVAAGGVDRIVTDNLAAGSPAATVVTLTAAQQTAITASVTLAAAVDLAISNIDGAANNATTFTYGTDTYFLLNTAATSAAFTATDLIIKITGVVGTLNASDITIL